MSLFTYPVLEDPKRSIRLLKLVDGPAVECNIYCYLLADCPSYTAVSYTWGSSSDIKKILINNMPISISENAWHFLCQMRVHSEWRWRLYWIDAICIDQEDFEERHAQVSIMCPIYATAENVFVWLGISTPGSDLAMDSAIKSSQLLCKTSSYRQIWKDEEGKAILAICQRKYWTRVWIVQEIIYAKCILVLCGSKSLSWGEFGNVFQSLESIKLIGWFHRHSYGAEVLASPAAVIFQQKSKWEEDLMRKEKGLPFSILLELYNSLESTRLVDKVYGLLGLSSDKLPIDYCKAIKEVYNDVMRVCIPQCHSRAAKDRFANLLSQVLGLLEGNSGVLTVEDFMDKPAEIKNSKGR